MGTEGVTPVANPAPASLTGSIVIPAHNEGAVIGRCLRHLQDGSLPDTVEIVVVANGCTDLTASVAREACERAIVIEIPQASKPAAIRAGEDAATTMPRIYLDADVQMTGLAVADTLDVLVRAVAARPPAVYDVRGATWPVRRYFGARRAMPSLNRHAWGAGVYALSEEARRRFGEFPDVVGDDLWIDGLLQDGELAIVDTDPVIVTTPKDSRHLLRTLRRAQRGKLETRPDGRNGVRTGEAALHDLRRLPGRGLGACVDALAFVAFALIARLPTATSRAPRWERDDSTRQIEHAE